MKHGGGSIVLWGCFAAGETGALHKIDGIMGTENGVNIFKQHLKTSVREMKLGQKNTCTFRIVWQPTHRWAARYW
jgi:hypothetical protein